MAMTREQIVAMLAARHEAVQRHDLDFIVNQYSPDCEQISPFAGGTVKGREAIGKLYDAWFKSFPDLSWTIEETLIDGDRVTQMTTQSGTDTGGFMGLRPTGKLFRVPIVWVLQVKDGQFVHVRAIYDFTGLLVQIGALKAKPA
jgi:predicted ester cyclase